MRQKKKICKECRDEKYIFSKGMCQTCASKNFKGFSNNIKTLKSKGEKLKKSGNIKQVTEKQKENKRLQKEKRDVYFNHHLKLCKFSEESGEHIPNPNKSNICHLLPKSSHPSVEDNFDNYIYLTFKEHERLDYLLFSHKFKKIEKEFKNSAEIIWTRLKKVVYLSQETTQLSRAIKNYIDGRRSTQSE